MADQYDIHAEVRKAGGIVHSDGNIFFTNKSQFLQAALAIQVQMQNLGWKNFECPACGMDGAIGIEHWQRNAGVDVPPEAQPVPREMEQAIDAALDLHPISIRLPKALIERYKQLAAERGLIYQPLMRQALAEWIASGVVLDRGGQPDA